MAHSISVLSVLVLCGLEVWHDQAEVMKMPRENKVLREGDKAPDFTLRDASTGEMVSLDDLMGQPLMIIFGRGTW
jgi:cytochrome oxidase Cu insertion factor (SCO1/SenC/PrrC family)